MKSFRVRNVKSFIDSGEIELKPITLFVGQNSCGKSSLLRFPVVLAQTMNGLSDFPIELYGKMIDYGNFEDVVYGRKKKIFSFEIDDVVNINNPGDARYSGRYVQNGLIVPDEEKPVYENVRLQTTVKKSGKRIVIDKTDMFIGELHYYGFHRQSDGRYKVFCNYVYGNREFEKLSQEYIIDKVTYDQYHFFPIYDDESIFFAIFHEMYPELSDQEVLEKGDDVYIKIKSGEIDNQLTVEERFMRGQLSAFTYGSDIMSQIYRGLSDDSSYLSYIGPFRSQPERVYRDSGNVMNRVGVNGENLSNVLLRNSTKEGNRLFEMISEWCFSNLGYHLRIKEIGSSLFQLVLEDANGLQSNIIDVGYGVSQVLPIVTQIFLDMELKRKRKSYSSGFQKITCIEQPELHLHPAAQAELADLIAEAAVQTRDYSMLIETHSEHLIRRLQVLVSDPNQPLTNDMVKIYYVDKQPGGSAASVKEMKMNENGKFEKAWPSGFFDKASELSLQLMKKSAE